MSAAARPEHDVAKVGVVSHRRPGDATPDGRVVGFDGAGKYGWVGVLLDDLGFVDARIGHLREVLGVVPPACVRRPRSRPGTRGPWPVQGSITTQPRRWSSAARVSAGRVDSWFTS